MVRLFEETELPGALSGDNGFGAAPETAVVDSGRARLVVREFRSEKEFRIGNGQFEEFGLFGDVVAISRVFFFAHGFRMK